MKVYVIIINTLINTKNKFQYLKLIFIFFTFSNILYTSFLFYAFTSLVNYKIYYQIYFFNVPFHMFEKNNMKDLVIISFYKTKKLLEKCLKIKNYIWINEITLIFYQRKLCEVFSNLFFIFTYVLRFQGRHTLQT